MALRQRRRQRQWQQKDRRQQKERQQQKVRQQQKQQLLPWRKPVLHREDATPLRANSKNCSAGRRPALGRPLRQRERLRRPQKERQQQKQPCWRRDSSGRGDLAQNL